MTLDPHAPEDKLEEYCLGRRPAEAVEGFETHLLVCPQCQDALRETEAYVRAMRAAAALVAGEDASRSRWGRRWWVRIGLVALACGAAAALLAWWLSKAG